MTLSEEMRGQFSKLSILLITTSFLRTGKFQFSMLVFVLIGAAQLKGSLAAQMSAVLAALTRRSVLAAINYSEIRSAVLVYNITKVRKDFYDAII